MQKIKYGIKVIFLSISFFILIDVFVNLFIVGFYNFYLFSKKNILQNPEGMNQQYKLPSMQNHYWGEEMFEEMENATVKYTSYLGWVPNEFSGKHLNIDAKGRRKTSFNKNNNIYKKKVAFFGGSTMFGFGVSDDFTIPSITSELSKGEYLIENYGVNGYKSLQSFLKLNFLLSENNQIDISIAYEGVNEINYLLSDIDTPYSHSQETRMKGIISENGSNSEYDFVNYLKKINNPLLYIIKNKLVKNQFSNDVLIKNKVEIIAKSTLNSWMLMKDKIEKKGLIFICILQPNIYTQDYILDNYINLNLNRKKIYKLYYKNIKRLLKTVDYSSLRVNFHDFSHKLNGTKGVYMDEVHLTPKGNKIISEEILKILEKNERN